MTDALDIKGNLVIQKISTNEQIIETIHAHNNIVTTGRYLVAQRFIQTDVGTISYFAVGTGSSPVLPDEIKLNQENFRKKLPDLNIRNLEKITRQNREERIKLSIKADLETGEANGALTEAALFTAEPNSIMYNRVVFESIEKTKDFKLTLVWEILF
ncbi:hypothetical protein [Nostoc sp. ChiQUE01b]|uniref:hypothetical protein n=1 Tax=Nostoc sp. ChiQUE01b TaxID=3075376 RepID=UPI002AD3215F|nr:hypothetical protein [Nostoc sp. ChiQUE01b]MDZ8263317.1 hypothetical protein [Nostoc sp. ChiQUE01b]